MATSNDHPGLPFIQAKGYTRGRADGPPLWVVIHDMEASEGSQRAENTAAYFANPSDGRQVSSHYCLAPDTRILYGDLTWRPIGEAVEGDRLIGFDEYRAGLGQTRKLRESHITRAVRRMADCLVIELEDSRRVVCSMDHRWLGQRTRTTSGWRTNQQWLSADSLSIGDRIKVPLEPWATADDRRAGYLAGILDGEGCFTSDNGLSFAQKDGIVLDAAKQALADLGIPFAITDAREHTGVIVVRISGLSGTLRLAGSSRPVRLLADRLWLNKEMKSRTHDLSLRVASIERIGVREVVSIETTTATFFAEGMASHNCVDDNSVVQCVDLDDVAWTVGNRPGNYRGINWELAGFASQTREQWLDPFGVAMFHQMAPICASDMKRFKIPNRRCTINDLLNRRPGLTTHNDLRVAFGGTSHTDPGANFPFDYLIQVLDLALKPEVPMAVIIFVEDGPNGSGLYGSGGSGFFHLASNEVVPYANRWGIPIPADWNNFEHIRYGPACQQFGPYLGTSTKLATGPVSPGGLVPHIHEGGSTGPAQPA